MTFTYAARPDLAIRHASNRGELSDALAADARGFVVGGDSMHETFDMFGIIDNNGKGWSVGTIKRTAKFWMLETVDGCKFRFAKLDALIEKL